MRKELSTPMGKAEYLDLLGKIMLEMLHYKFMASGSEAHLYWQNWYKLVRNTDVTPVVPSKHAFSLSKMQLWIWTHNDICIKLRHTCGKLTEQDYQEALETTGQIEAYFTAKCREYGILWSQYPVLALDQVRKGIQA